MQIPVRIVLVETSHPGNIGASARAMKTMGLSELALVAPREFPCDAATARASGADDVLRRARIHATLTDAISDCSLVVGASARIRSVPCPIVNPRTCAEFVSARLASERVAIVMGPEQSGLTNEQLASCQQLVHIPTDDAYGSLNLAAAVQVICYELRMAALQLGSDVREPREAQRATAGELEGFHAHMEEVLGKAGFFDPNHPRRLKLKLRRIFHRADLDRNEINILRGALSALDPDRVRSSAKR